MLITTDRLSAFDQVLTAIPFKGEILNRLAQFWFEKTRHMVNNHLLDMPDPNVMVGRLCQPFAVEVVVRGYLTGSLWRDYQKGSSSAYGIPFPVGLRKDQAFAQPLLTPSTKEALGKHDQPISEKEIVGRGLVNARDWAFIAEAALQLFSEGQVWAKSRGLILVDTKYEFGKAGNQIYLIDEIHTPDSSRYWISSEYASRFAAGEEQQMLDKENIRQWLIKERGFSGEGRPPEIPDDVRVSLAEKYVSAYQQITGEIFSIEAQNTVARIEHNLKLRHYL